MAFLEGSSTLNQVGLAPMSWTSGQISSDWSLSDEDDTVELVVFLQPDSVIALQANVNI
jgi:hypothetical protein